MPSSMLPLDQSYSRGFAPRTPLHALSRAASSARSGRVARSHLGTSISFMRQLLVFHGIVKARLDWTVSLRGLGNGRDPGDLPLESLRIREEGRPRALT